MPTRLACSCWKATPQGTQRCVVVELLFGAAVIPSISLSYLLRHGNNKCAYAATSATMHQVQLCVCVCVCVDRLRCPLELLPASFCSPFMACMPFADG